MKSEVPKVAVSPDEITKIIESTQQSIVNIETEADNAREDLKEYQEELEYLRSIITFQTRLTHREEGCTSSCTQSEVDGYRKTLLNNVTLSCAQERVEYLEQEIPNIHQIIKEYQQHILSLHTDIKLLQEISSHRLTKENENKSANRKSKLSLIGRTSFKLRY